METKLTTWQKQGLFNSLVEMQGEEGRTVGHNVSLQERKAPKAMPEEDLEAPERGTEDKALCQSQKICIIETVDVIKPKTQKSTDISQRSLSDTQEATRKLGGGPEKLSDEKQEPKQADYFCEYDFPPPPPPLSALSAAEDGEKEEFSSLEGELGEWISEAESNEDVQEGPKTLKRLEPSPQGVDRTSQLNSTTVTKAGDIGASIAETCTAQSVQLSLSDMNSSEDRNTLNSPPFADESGEEEGAGGDTQTHQQQLDTRELSCVGFLPLCSYPEETYSDLPANSSVRQEEAVLPQSQSEPCPRGLNKEAAQQVFGQGSPPGSAVATELTNQGGEASQGHSCVAAVREKSSRVGERTERENEQTGGAKVQNKSGVKKSKPAVRSPSGGLFKYLQAVQTPRLKKENSCGIPLKARGTRMRTDTYDDSQSDSGVSTDFQSHRTHSSSTGESADSPGPVSTETPIEREIRRAVEREQSLRRSRGLPNHRTTTEYVEVPLRKSLLTQSVTPKWSQNKDREFAGKKMQHEIHEETRREQDLVKIGKIPGFYDKGTVRQLKERKQLFETLQISPESPLMFSPKSKTPSWSSTSSEDLNLTLESQDESGTSTPEHTYMGRRPLMSNSSQSQTSAIGVDPSNIRGPRFSDETSCQIIILENSQTVPAQKELEIEKNLNSSGKTRGYDGLIEKMNEQKEAAVSKENPFFKLRSSANLDIVRQDIQAAKDREKELHTLRLSLYGDISGVESSSKNEMPAPGPLPNGRNGSYEGRQPVDQVSGWRPVQSKEEKIFHPEIRNSPRTPRQKNPLVQLWESGLVNGYNLEDD